MSKFSVKKPMTVFVAVIVILVLGVVSFMNMTPDLLPSIDLPYVMVITAAPGSTPEKVETMVSKPLEQAMATLEHIESVSSVSSENSSMVILQFQDAVDMDSATVDMLQKITQLSEYWDDTVGTPYILKLNPSMLPTAIFAVDMEGLSTAQLSRFANDDLLPKLEGIPGVASINASGLVFESVQVALSQSRIDALNKDVRKAIDKQFSEKQDELNDTRDEVSDGIDKIDSAMAELNGKIEETAGQLGDASSQISQKELELLETKMSVMQQIATLNENLESLEETEKLLKEVIKGYSELDKAKAQLEETITQLETLQQQLTALAAFEAQFALQIAEIQNSPLLTDEEKQLAIAQIQQSQEYLEVMAGLAAIDAQLAAQGYTRDSLPELIAQAQAGLLEVEAGYAALDNNLAAQGLARADLDKNLKKVKEGKVKLKDGILQLNTALSALEDGSATISQAKAELEKQKLQGTIQFSEGSAQMMLTQSELNSALEQIDAGLEQMDDARADAYAAANLENIITMDMVSAILSANNFSMPAGYVSQDGVQTLVRVGENIESTEEIQDLMLLDLQMDGLAPIYLSDVADITLVSNSGEVYAKLNGRNGVLLTFTKQSTYATATVSQGITAKLDELKGQYPGLSYVALMDQGDYIDIVIRTVMENLLWGALFAIIVLFLFLRDVRPTFITLCSIPISVIFAIVLMYFSGVTINIISLSGLAVGVGMLVDNSVVVIENIYRLRSRGESVIKAAVSGAAQVAGAITASTLTTICVFVPIVFTEGITRKLFTDMALTLGYSLIASLIVALTLVPAMSAGLLKKSQPKEGRLLKAVQRFYQRTASFTLNHKILSMAVVLILLVASILPVMAKGFIFMPEMDMPELTVTLEAPEDSSTAQTMEFADEASEQILALPEVETVGAMLSGGTSILGIGGAGTGGESTSATLYVLLNENASGNAMAKTINALFEDAPYTLTASGSSSMSDMMGALGGSGVSVEIYGSELDTMIDTARLVANEMARVPGAINVDDGVGDTEPELRFIVDKNKAMRHGLTVAQVYQQVASALSTENTATSITLDETDVIVFSPGHETMTPEKIRAYSFMHQGASGEEERIYLRDIAEIVETETATSISRADQRRYMTVSAEVAEGYNVALVSADVESALARLDLPAGVSLEFTGENASIMDAFEDLLLMLLLGVILVYLIMVAQFQSLKSPFIVMFTIPLAFTGGFFALLITGTTFSVIAAIGMVMLVGIIVNNGIVLVDYINQLRLEGMPTREAIIKAGQTRLRPILMTSVTTILGLFVMALGTGTGGELMQPVAIVCIGGLTYATILTLYIVPVMYEAMNRKALKAISDEDLTISEL